MIKLTDWLAAIPTVSDIREITVTIKGTVYQGAAYRDANFANEPRYYMLGRLPAYYRRSARTAFVIDGADWYIACYITAERITPEYAPYHPCGEHFMLCRWQVPNGDAIDCYEPRHYRRVSAICAAGVAN